MYNCIPNKYLPSCFPFLSPWVRAFSSPWVGRVLSRHFKITSAKWLRKRTQIYSNYWCSILYMTLSHWHWVHESLQTHRQTNTRVNYIQVHYKTKAIDLCCDFRTIQAEDLFLLWNMVGQRWHVILKWPGVFVMFHKQTWQTKSSIKNPIK